MANELLPAVRIEPKGAEYSVIWLHGLGADGHDFKPIVSDLNFRNKAKTRFIFPHAPAQSVTINNGYVMPAWYDIHGIGEEYEQDEAGVRLSEQRIKALIDYEASQGIAFDKMLIAGFSQGGAIALHTALRFAEKLAGILALSTYLPLHESIAKERSETNRSIPIMMMHGEYDPVVPIRLAEMSKQHLFEQDYSVQWQTYPMEHSVCPPQIDNISQWFDKILN